MPFIYDRRRRGQGNFSQFGFMDDPLSRSGELAVEGTAITARNTAGLRRSKLTADAMQLELEEMLTQRKVAAGRRSAELQYNLWQARQLQTNGKSVTEELLEKGE